MQISQSFSLPYPPQTVWQAFEDIALVVHCLPGASLTGDIVNGTVPMRFDVRLGPIKAGFVGSGQVALNPASRSGSFDGSAADRTTQSRVKGQAKFTVADNADGSLVEVTVDYALTGSLAQFSRGAIVRELANALTTEFAANLEAKISEGMKLEPTIITQQASAPKATPLSVFRLAYMVMSVRWRRLVAWCQSL
jgi:carbon monoxide dehydrogenase subunit G